MAVNVSSNRAPTTPTSVNYRQPAEWRTHTSVWLAWPAHPEVWGRHLEGARAQFTALCRVIASDRTGAERLEILTPDAEQERDAARTLQGLDPRFHRIQYGDIWLRDTGPIFVTDPNGGVAAARFGFNGWGGKYCYPYDDRVALEVVNASGLPHLTFDWVLEGGAIEVDGEGTCLASRGCLLDPVRFAEQDAELAEARLRQALGVRKLIWLEGSLQNDHTDGHADTLARFVAPGVVVCMEPVAADDPNRDTLESIARQLERAVDSIGRKLAVLRVPSPGRVRGDEHEVMPASYLNFYIGNRAVIVPTFGCPQDERAVGLIAGLFPDRRTVGLRANHILEGGGAFHCITQQQPAPFVASYQTSK